MVDSISHNAYTTIVSDGPIYIIKRRRIVEDSLCVKLDKQPTEAQLAAIACKMEREEQEGFEEESSVVTELTTIPARDNDPSVVVYCLVNVGEG